MLKVLLVSMQAFAQSAAPAVSEAAPQQAPAWMQFVPFVLIIGVFYFFLLRPQAKKQKETADFNASLKSGDAVITQSGILGRIISLTDQVVVLEIAHDTQIKVMRSQIVSSQSVLQVKKEGK